MHRPAGFGEKIQHLDVQRLERMTAIHNQHQTDELPPRLQIIAQQGYPMLTHRLRHGRVAVTGQINHKMPVGQFEKIDMLRTAGRF